MPSVDAPTLLEAEWSMPVNAMAYCKMALLKHEPGGKGKGREEGLVAVPALTKDELVGPSLGPECRSPGQS